jgi:hypothetical protein
MNCQHCNAYASRERLYTLLRGGDPVAHFCCLDCCLHWAADHSAPTQEVR